MSIMSDTIKISEKNEIKALAKALSSDTRYKIAVLLKDKELPITKIADELGQTEANISAQIKFLEKAKIVECRYEPGDHGVRKICKTEKRIVVINL